MVSQLDGSIAAFEVSQLNAIKGKAVKNARRQRQRYPRSLVSTFRKCRCRFDSVTIHGGWYGYGRGCIRWKGAGSRDELSRLDGGIAAG
jgi:hypothetical protein